MKKVSKSKIDQFVCENVPVASGPFYNPTIETHSFRARYLVDIILRPKYYFWCVMVPGRFDCAEALLQCWEALSKEIKMLVKQILIDSKKYRELSEDDNHEGAYRF